MHDKFDEFWGRGWRDLFAIDPETGITQYPINSKSPKADGICYALLARQNREMSTWDFGVLVKG